MSGANGMSMELWVSPEDRLIHRVQLRNPRSPDMASDIRIETESGGFYFPIVTCLIISVVLSLVLWFLRR